MKLQASKVEVHRGGAKLLAGVSVDVAAGEIAALVGPNGAGKSTLMSVLCGETRPDAGEVHLDGKPVADLDPLARAARLAVLPQQSRLDFPFLVQEVVDMGRFNRAVVPGLVTEVMAALDVAALADRVYTTLSGGEQARVQAARVIAQLWDDPAGNCIMLDEPAAALDLRHQLVLFEVLQQLTSQGMAVIVVLHDLNLAARFADRMWLMAEGKLLAEGLPVEVLEPGNIRAAFGVEAEVLAAGNRLLVSY